MREERRQLMRQWKLTEAEEVRCYHCNHWGYNMEKGMTRDGHSLCAVTHKFTKSGSYCKCFSYVGNGR